jgi:hypothetical protein
MVYVAALVPTAFPSGGEVASRVAALQTAGYETQPYTDAGLLACGTLDTVRALRKTPEGLAQLAAVVGDAVAILEASGVPRPAED